MGTLSFLILFIFVLAIPWISFLMFPQKVGEISFWLNVVWIVFLVFINWVASSYTFFKVKGESKSPQFGILPGLHIIILMYSIVSLSLMFMDSSLSPYKSLLQNGYFICQIIAGTICAIVVILSLIAAKGAETTTVTENLLSKEDLITILEKFKGPQEIKGFKELLENIKYSMPHPSRLRTRKNYQNLCEIVSKLEDEKIDQALSEQMISQIGIIAKNCR